MRRRRPPPPTSPHCWRACRRAARSISPAPTAGPISKPRWARAWTTLVVYAARARDGWDDAEAEAVGKAQAALHYSERSAALAVAFAERAGLGPAFRRMPHVSLSRAAAAPLAAFGVTRALWPSQPVEAALLETLESALADLAGL